MHTRASEGILRLVSGRFQWMTFLDSLCLWRYLVYVLVQLSTSGDINSAGIRMHRVREGSWLSFNIGKKTKLNEITLSAFQIKSICHKCVGQIPGVSMNNSPLYIFKSHLIWSIFISIWCFQTILEFNSFSSLFGFANRIAYISSFFSLFMLQPIRLPSICSSFFCFYASSLPPVRLCFG